MNTNHNPRFGAVHALLVSTGFARRAARLARLFAIAAALLFAAPGWAASGGSSGGGTMYFTGPFPGATTGGTAVMTTMNSDGSGKTVLGLDLFGNPSLILYNNRRWFVYTDVILDPDGVTKRGAVFAYRDDYDINDNNNAATKVQLTTDLTLEPRGGTTDWVPGGTQITFMGRRRASTEPGAALIEGGIYTATLAFDAAGNIIGLAEQPAEPAISFPLVETAPGDLWPALSFFSWDPTGTIVAYQTVGVLELWLADRSQTHTRIRVGQSANPRWSPDGLRIMFHSGAGIGTISPNGTGYKLIVPSSSTWVFVYAHYSPSGSHIFYSGWQQGQGISNADIFRATSKGGSRVNLSNTPHPLVENTHPGAGAGWR